MAEPRIIKRYANRKLYDTHESRYVTLEQIAGLVRAGEDVRIVDNTTKEDLTSVTLTQIVLDGERKDKRLPPSSLRQIIQSSGASLQQLARPGAVRDLLESSHKTIEDLQRRLDDRMRQALANLSPLAGLQKEVQALAERVARLESEIEALKRR